jgi:hypothetical protein
MKVYLLEHTHLLPGGEEEEDVKLIGVYATQEDAEQARQRAITKPGFRDSPEGFCISEHTVGEDNWTEGFVTMTHEMVIREWEKQNSQNNSN